MNRHCGGGPGNTKSGTARRGPAKSNIPPADKLRRKTFPSVLLPERFGGFPPCTFGPRFRASPEPHPFPVLVPESFAPSAGLRRFSGNFLCRYSNCRFTLPRSGGVVNRVFPQNVRKAETNIRQRRTLRGARRRAVPNERNPEGVPFPAFSKIQVFLTAPERRPRRRWRKSPAGGDPHPDPCEAAGRRWRRRCAARWTGSE